MDATAFDRFRAACERAIAALVAHRDAGPSIIGETPLLFQYRRVEPAPALPSWREKIQLRKAVVFETIRCDLPDVWTLLDIVESANPPDRTDDEYSDVTLPARDGWQVSLFYDCRELDYIDRITSPDGIVFSPWDWLDGAPGRQALMNWRGVGDRARLIAFRDEHPARVIDCTDLPGDRPVDEDERDGIVSGHIDLLGGYLDWEASVVRRTPVPAKDAA